MTAPDTREIVDAFHLQLGRTLAKWQWVEESTYNLYSHMMKGIDQRLISVNWHHIQSFDARIKLLDACAYFTVSEPLKDRWKELRIELEKSSKTRNLIVHSMFGIRVESGIASAQLSVSHMDAMAVVRSKIHKNELRPEFSIDQARLTRHMREFTALAQKLLGFRAVAFGLTDSEKNSAD